MPIVVNINSGVDREPVSEGVHSVVLADVVDLGVLPTAFGDKHKVQFVYLTDEADEAGKTKYLFERFTASLHEKASLRKRVKQLLGGKEPDGSAFDLESLIGTQARVVVEHNEGNDGKVYANVASVMKPDPKVRVDIPSDFTRQQNKPGYQGPKKPNAAVKAAGGGKAAAAAVLSRPQQTQPISDEDIPF